MVGAHEAVFGKMSSRCAPLCSFAESRSIDFIGEYETYLNVVAVLKIAYQVVAVATSARNKNGQMFHVNSYGLMMIRLENCRASIVGCLFIVLFHVVPAKHYRVGKGIEGSTVFFSRATSTTGTIYKATDAAHF